MNGRRPVFSRASKRGGPAGSKKNRIHQAVIPERIHQAVIPEGSAFCLLREPCFSGAGSTRNPVSNLLHSAFSRSASIAAACLSVALLAYVIPGCSNSGAPAQANITPVSNTTGSAAAPPSPATKRPEFDGGKAFQILVKQCDFGPRPVGSEAHQKTRDYLVAEMGKYADRTAWQDFTYKKMPLTNVIGVFNPGAKRSVLLCTHWDTRPRADQEVDRAKKKMPILGASDGASGGAVLLELARIFKQQKPEIGVILVLLDGEDYGDFELDEGVFLGSRYFARNHQGYNPEYGILLDMVGDKDLDIYREGNSDRMAPGTNTKVFTIAKELGYGKYIIDHLKHTIVDDHISLTTLGRIPTIDLIDFDYAPWHTLDDTPANCSAKSLAIVGNTLAEVIYREKP